MLILKHLKNQGRCEKCLLKRKWQQILLKMGFLGPKNSKEERKFEKLKLL